MNKYVHIYDVIQINFGKIQNISFNNNIDRKCVLLILYKAEFKNTLMN